MLIDSKLSALAQHSVKPEALNTNKLQQYISSHLHSNRRSEWKVLGEKIQPCIVDNEH